MDLYFIEDLGTKTDYIVTDRAETVDSISYPDRESYQRSDSSFFAAEYGYRFSDKYFEIPELIMNKFRVDNHATVYLLEGIE